MRNTQTLSVSHAMVIILASWAVFADARTEPAAQPNILFILTDDQGYGDMSRHGNPVLKTPNLDRLQDQSVRFTDFCVSSSCSPTRAALMSGKYPLRVGVTHTISPRHNMDLQVTTLPQLLKRVGYTTACVGKWHLGGDMEDTNPYNPKQRGFDVQVKNPGRPREDRLFDEAIKFMGSSAAAGKPFFCYLASWFPHMASSKDAPEDEMAKFRGMGYDDNTVRFLAMVSNIDKNVGRIIGWLDRQPFATNTVVVVMNDNGGTQGIDIWNAGMRGCKCTAWPGGSRAFSFWRWPAKWRPRDVDALTAHLDVLPTLADLAGVHDLEKQAPGLDGHSLRALLEGRSDAWFNDRMVFQHNARWGSGFAALHKERMAGVRWQRYLLVNSSPCGNPACTKDSQCPALRRVAEGDTVATYTTNAPFHWGLTPGAGWALYDLQQDWACQSNRFEQSPEIAGRLLQAYDKWWDAIYQEMLAAGGDVPLDKRKEKK